MRRIFLGLAVLIVGCGSVDDFSAAIGVAGKGDTPESTQQLLQILNSRDHYNMPPIGVTHGANELWVSAKLVTPPQDRAAFWQQIVTEELDGMYDENGDEITTLEGFFTRMSDGAFAMKSGVDAHQQLERYLLDSILKEVARGRLEASFRDGWRIRSWVRVYDIGAEVTAKEVFIIRADDQRLILTLSYAHC
jgi:hypothetical protein